MVQHWNVMQKIVGSILLGIISISIYIYLIYSIRNNGNNSISGDTHDHLKKHKNRFEEYRTKAACGRGSCSRFPLVPVHMKTK